MAMKPNEDEVKDAIGDAEAAEEEGTQFPAMSYEQGVAAGLRWVLDGGDHPLAE